MEPLRLKCYQVQAKMMRTILGSSFCFRVHLSGIAVSLPPTESVPVKSDYYYWGLPVMPRIYFTSFSLFRSSGPPAEALLQQLRQSGEKQAGVL